MKKNLLILILLLTVIGLSLYITEQEPTFVPCSPRTHTIRVQEWLVSKGHEIEVDGRWGDLTETAFCDEMASEDFE